MGGIVPALVVSLVARARPDTRSLGVASLFLACLAALPLLLLVMARLGRLLR